MNTERHGHWKKLIEEQSQSGLFRRAFGQNNNLILSQFSYYYFVYKKEQQKGLVSKAEIIPINLRKEPSMPAREVKVLLPNGLQMLLPCTDECQLKRWMEALQSC